MLRRVLTALAAWSCVALGLGAPSASAAVTCPPGQAPNPSTGICVIIVTGPGDPGNPGEPGKSGGPGRGAPPRCVSQITGREWPCRDGNSWWSNAWSCYVKARDPQPAVTDPVWEGHTDGAIYDCYNPDITGTRMTQRWSATSPGGPAAPPDPRVLAQLAIATMNLHAVTIGIVPEARRGSVGIVGMPTWMWAAAPSASSWGPITRSASAAGYTVTATARVRRVVWDMGDGSVVTCNGPGTPYRDSFGKRSSPTCGHTYTRQGMYPVRATSHWVVTWSGVGQSGTIPLDLTQTTTITMGEVQVLVQ